MVGVPPFGIPYPLWDTLPQDNLPPGYPTPSGIPWDTLSPGYPIPSGIPYPLLLTSDGHHQRPVQTCSLDALSPHWY